MDEVANDLRIHSVETLGDVALRTTSGSIIDARNDDLANIIGLTVDLDANGGSIGEAGDDLEIDSRAGLGQEVSLEANTDDVALEAETSIWLTETDGELRLALAHAYLGNITLTVREAAGATSTGEDLQLIRSGDARFAESDDVLPGTHDDAPRPLPHGLILAEAGEVTLNVGDDVDVHENAAIVAAGAIDLFADHTDNDAGFGATVVLRGQIIAGAIMVVGGNRAPSTPSGTTRVAPIGTWRPDDSTTDTTAADRTTRIFGNTDVDTIQFGDESGVAGGTQWGDDGYIYLGSRTRAFGSADATATTGDDGEDRFRIYYLQDMAAETAPAISAIGFATEGYDSQTGGNAYATTLDVGAQHTLTLDGQADTDSYEVFTLGSQGDFRNYVINVLDTGAEDDGADTLDIFGGEDDDLFLLRGAAFLPNETAEKAGFVALLHGQLDEYADTLQGNETSVEVQRIAYDDGINGRLTVEGRGGDDGFYSDDVTVTATMDGGAGDDTFQIGQIFGANRNEPDGNLLPQDVFPALVPTTRGWLSQGSSAPVLAQGGTGNDTFRVYSNQSELRLEGDDDNDLFIVRAFAIAATTDFDWDGDGDIDQDDLEAGLVQLIASNTDTNGDGGINYLDVYKTLNDTTDDVIVLDEDGVARPQIGLGFSVAQAPDIRAGGGQDEVRYNVNAPVSVDGGTGFDKLVILGTEFADDIVITEGGIFGAGLNVRYSTVEVVEVDGLEGDDEFFVQSTAFGVAYRVIGGLGSDTINVAGDVVEDIVTRELEGISGAVDHRLSSGDALYDGLVVDGLDYNVTTDGEGLVVVDEGADGFTAVREGGPNPSDSYSVRLARALTGSEVVYVTVSAPRSPQEERDETFDNPAPLPNGAGESIWLSTDPLSGTTNNTFAGLETAADDSFLREVVVDGQTEWAPNRGVVLRFDKDNWDQAQNVYLWAPDDTRAEGDRVVAVQHSVISRTSADYDAIDVRNVEVQLRDNDTPGVLVTELDPTTLQEDGRTLVVEGDGTGLSDKVSVQLTRAPEPGDTIVVKLNFGGLTGDAALADLTDKAIEIGSGDARFDADALTLTFDASNWDAPVILDIDARDDFVREDPEIAVIGFNLDAATVDPNGDFAFPNLRSGTGLLDIEVIDNETPGSVVLEDGADTVLTPDDPNTVADESVTDLYRLRLTKEPDAPVQVAILTDGLADVASVDGVAPSYQVIGGLRPVQLYTGQLIFGSDGGQATITRGDGADLGSFEKEGWEAGDLIRVGGSGVDGDYEVLAVSDQTLTLTAAGFAAATTDDVILSELIEAETWTGAARYDVVDGTARLERIESTGATAGWLGEGFVEGQRVRVSAGGLSVDAKIAIIRGFNDTQDAVLQFTSPSDAALAATFTEGATATFTVERIAAVTTFTAADYFNLREIELEADPFYEVPTTREGVKVFPVKAHRLSDIRGPLAVEGGPAGADRSLSPGVKLPGETDDFLIAIGTQAPESQQIDVLNVFNDGSLADTTGTLTETTLTGFGMGPDLVFPDVSGPIFGEGPEGQGPQTLSFPGGISFGKVNFGASGVTNDGVESTVEVVNVMLGQGNDRLDVEGTLNPAPATSAENAFTATEGWSDPDFQFLFDRTDFGGKLMISREGFDWKAEGFLVGQEVFAETANGTLVSLGRIIGIEDDLAYGPGETDPMTGEPLRDPNDNSLLVLGASTLPAGVDFSGSTKLVARDADVAVQLVATVATTAGGATLSRASGDWSEDGVLEGHLLGIDTADGTRLQVRVVEISEDGRTLTVEGEGLDDGPLDALFWVQGRHGGLTVLHGGGNLQVTTTGTFDFDGNSLTRLDGRDFAESRFEVGQVIQLEGEDFTREILAIGDADPADFGEEDSFDTWGTGSVLVLGDPLAAGGATLVAGTLDTTVYVADAYTETLTSTIAIEVEEIDGTLETIVRRTDGDTFDGIAAGSTIFIEGQAGGFTVDRVLDADTIVLRDTALADCDDGPLTGTLILTVVDITRSGGQRIGGDHFVVTGGAGPDSPLVIYGDTSQDGIWYSGRPSDRLGLEFGEKPFDPFPNLPDAENEDDEWIFPLANPFDYHGNDIIDASALFADLADQGLFPSVGITAYGGRGNDLIIGSQTGDHLAGGSGDDTIIGQRGTDHIYGDSGINVDILTRALTVSTLDASPAPSLDPTQTAADSTFAPVPSPVRDPMGAAGAGQDMIEGNGSGISDGTPDIIFGDHGRVDQLVIDPNEPFDLPQKIQTTLLSSVVAIVSVEPQTGGDDVIFGSEIDDILIGGAGADAIDGGEGDDLIFGDNVDLSRRGGDDGSLYDDIASLRFQTLAGSLMYSRSDRPASAGYDLNDVSGPNSGVLMVSLDEDGKPIARDYRDPNGPSWWAEYDIDYARYHTFAVADGLEGQGAAGNDYIAGGAGNDQIFGQLGNDVIQGDGTIDGAVTGRGDGTIDGITAPERRVGAARNPLGPEDPVGALKVVSSLSDDPATDGTDYIEGGGGCDVIFGGLGQDDLVGGSSSFFGLSADERPDGQDKIFGGSGVEISRNDADLPGDGTDALGAHARDADAIVGDNGDIIRLVGVNGIDLIADEALDASDPAIFGPQYEALYHSRNGLFLSFVYDRFQVADGETVADYAAEDGERVVVRGVTLLDYTAGGPDFRPDLFDLDTPVDADKNAGLTVGQDDLWRNTFGFWSRTDIGGADEVHGETGDDIVYLGGGADIAYGDAGHDDIIGGWGADWISGGTGVDGILGDDGRIFTSRNTGIVGNAAYGEQYAEGLFGIYSLLTNDPDRRTSQGNVLNEAIYTPGKVQQETINIAFEIVKSVDLTPFDSDASSIFAPVYAADPNEHDPIFADDVLFGGLGQDFIHGGSGDDAIGGHEVLSEAYVQRYGTLPDVSVDIDQTGVIGLARTDFTRPWNPSNILVFNSGDAHWNEPTPTLQRTGEFYLYDEYDPRRTILFEEDGTLWKDGAPDGKKQYFLNAPDTEGELIGGYTEFAPNGTPIESSWIEVHSDGDDRLFGDMGNDWIVGGTGRDHIYGGFGNDLMNGDDVVGVPGDGGASRDTTGALNDAPETHRVWEDRIFGGAGLDILIGNTGGDRLIDHLGEFNSYIVPFAPFGIATVSRQVPPQLWDFLAAQAFSDGVDMTRTADIGPNHESRYSNVIQEQGDPYGELGLVTQRDRGFWQDQSGPPTDPQAGNIPGGRRDILRTADFNDRTTQGFAADTGSFTAEAGIMNVTSEIEGQKASGVFLLDDFLPTYYELAATVNLDKPTGGWKANAYIIFDYHSDVDFKFAGINVSTNKIEMGYVDASGWHYTVQSNKPVRIKPGQNYDLLVAVNGNNVTLQVADVNWFSHDYTPRIDAYGMPVPLNGGMVGIGMDGSKGRVDNFRVQTLPPDWTLDETDDFSPPVAELPRVSQSAGWVETSGRLVGTVNGTAPSVQTVDLGVGLQANAVLEMEVDIETDGMAGFVFDRYDALNYKFVALDADGGRILVGHATDEDGQVIDASFAVGLSPNGTDRLKLTTQGAGLAVSLNGGEVGSVGFNAVLSDGAFGLMVLEGAASFDDFRLATDDPQFEDALRLASRSAVHVSGDSYIVGPELDIAVAQPIYEQAVADWVATGLLDDADIAALGEVTIVIADLEGDTLARTIDGDTILIDTTAAGAGWYLDATAPEVQGTPIRAVDLLTVMRHEIGHLLGLEHESLAIMAEELESGQRVEVSTEAASVTPPAPEPEPEPVPVEDPAPEPAPAPNEKAKGKGKKRASADHHMVFDPESGTMIAAAEAEQLFGLRQSGAELAAGAATAVALSQIGKRPAGVTSTPAQTTAKPRGSRVARLIDRLRNIA